MSEHTLAQQALDRAKIQLMAKPSSAFITTVCLSLRHRWNTEIPTARTNGYFIEFSPSFFSSLTSGQQLTLLLHETWHVALHHVLRGAGKNLMKYNIAADYFINDMLVQAGNDAIPNWLHDVKYHDLSTDEIYELLPDPPEGFSFECDLMPPGEGDGAGQEALDQHIDDILVRAAMQANAQANGFGNIPGELAFYIDKLVNPKLPWYRILAKYLTKMGKTGHSYLRPNRRFLPQYIIPSRYSEAVADIVVFTDVSGSVTDEEFSHFLSETYSILNSMKPDKLTFVQFDTRIVSEDVIRNPQDLRKVEFSGRGGTLISPVIKWLEDKKPTIAIVFSDGDFSHRDADPGVPILWVVHSNPDFTAPYGKVIEYNFSN